MTKWWSGPRLAPATALSGCRHGHGTVGGGRDRQRHRPQRGRDRRPVSDIPAGEPLYDPSHLRRVRGGTPDIPTPRPDAAGDERSEDATPIYSSYADDPDMDELVGGFVERLPLQINDIETAADDWESRFAPPPRPPARGHCRWLQFHARDPRGRGTGTGWRPRFRPWGVRLLHCPWS